MAANVFDGIDLDSPAHRCPSCGGRLQRVQRRWHDRLLSLFQPVIRCRCESRACGWRGLVDRHGTGRPRLSAILRSPLFIALALMLAVPPIALSARYVGKHWGAGAGHGAHDARALDARPGERSLFARSGDGVPLPRIAADGTDPLDCASAPAAAREEAGAWTRFLASLGLVDDASVAEPGAPAQDLSHCAEAAPAAPTRRP